MPVQAALMAGHLELLQWFLEQGEKLGEIDVVRCLSVLHARYCCADGKRGGACVRMAGHPCCQRRTKATVTSWSGRWTRAMLTWKPRMT